MSRQCEVCEGEVEPGWFVCKTCRDKPAVWPQPCSNCGELVGDAWCADCATSAERERLRARNAELIARCEELERIVGMMELEQIDIEEDALIHGHERQRFLCNIEPASAGGGYEKCDVAKERDALRAQVEQLKQQHKQLGANYQARVDAAEAEVEELTRERDGRAAVSGRTRNTSVKSCGPECMHCETCGADAYAYEIQIKAALREACDRLDGCDTYHEPTTEWRKLVK